MTEANAFKRIQVGSEETVSQVPGLSLRRSLARIFHSLLSSSATSCAKNFPLCADLSNIRAKHKTARRFCFSSHFPAMVDEAKPDKPASGRKRHCEYEKCGLGDCGNPP